MNQNNFYIQYHNADKLRCFPTEKTDFNSLISEITLNDDIKEHDSWIYTKKKTAKKATNGICFLIVGKTENKIKNYYLWSCFKIEDYEENLDRIIVIGTGQDLKKPILLNNLPDFISFKKFCGNFGIGFQNITKNDFSLKLFSYIKDNKGIFSQANQKISLYKEIRELNSKMLFINPERKVQEIDKILRKDKKIVELLKKLVDYKCQFPECNSTIPTEKGVNYVEVAHIKPIFKGGKSILGNLIVFCPNHHKEFDLGIKEILEDNMETISGILNGKNFKIDLHNNYTYKVE